MKHARIAGLAVLAAALWSAHASCANKPDTLSYEVKLKCKLGDMGTRKMYIKGSEYAWYVDSAGLKTRLVRNKDGVFLLHPMRPAAAKFPPGSNRESPMVCLPGPAGNVKRFLSANDARKSGEDKINKKACILYTYTEKVTRDKCKLWIEKAAMTPVRLVIEDPHPDRTVTADYVSYRLGCPVADSHFELPKGTQIQPMPTAPAPSASKRGP